MGNNGQASTDTFRVLKWLLTALVVSFVAWLVFGCLMVGWFRRLESI